MTAALVPISPVAMIEEPQPPPPKPRWVVSVDVGQAVDPTAIAVLEVTPHARWFGPDSPLLPVTIGERAMALVEEQHARQAPPPARIDVRHLERLPLKMSYVDQCAYVASLLRRPPLDRLKPMLCLDQTGVGRPIVDLFRRGGLKPTGVTIVAGHDVETRTPEGDWRVSKLKLVSRLQAALHAGELRIAAGLGDATALVEELQNFRATISESGFARFGAREGQHDDLVLAVAIGAWLAGRQRGIASFTMYI